jgi:hypothetical protein
MFEELACEDCGGKGIDLGSVSEPESCAVCLGSGKQLVELDTRSSLYGQRKPMGCALPETLTAGKLAERGGQ